MLFLVAGFSAVSDFGQELANVFYFFLGPEMYGHAAACGGFGIGNFASLDITAQSHGSNAKFLSCLIGGKRLHSDEI